MDSTDDPYVNLPEAVRTQAKTNADIYRKQVAKHREHLLVPGGYEIKAVRETHYGNLNYAPDLYNRLAPVDEWWEFAMEHAGYLVTLAGDYPDSAEALRSQAADVLGEVVRARNCALLAMGKAITGAGMRVRIEPDGSVLVAETRIPLPSTAAAGHPAPSAVAMLTIAPGADPKEISDLLRKIAADYESGTVLP